jgi:4-hydroxyphenylacetate 3-monooxygenase
VPWDRLFVNRDVDLCRAQFHDTPGHIFQNYQSQIRLVVKLKFLVGLAHKLTETIGTSNMPQVREQLGRLAANAGMVEAMLHGMEASGEHYGKFWIPNRHHLYSSQVVTQELYPKMINVIRELAGGAFIMIAPIIRKTQRSAVLDPEEKVKFLKAAWDAIGSEFGSRHTQYEMFYAGAQFVTAGHSFRTYAWDDAELLVKALLSSFALADAQAPALH